jgi:hypothetical protein
MRGRVAAVNGMFVSSSNELGAFESGLAAKYLGTITATIWWMYDLGCRRNKLGKNL